MYLFIEKGLSGRIYYIAKRYSGANNKYMKNYDSTKPSIYIEYLDMNNLYGWTMSGYIPYGGFKWLKNVDNFDVNSVSENSPVGYILKLILSILKNYMYCTMIIHQLQKKLTISYDMLLDYCKNVADKYGIKVVDVKNLIPNLGNKTNYVAHYRNLQLYLSLGMKLKFIKC